MKDNSLEILTRVVGPMANNCFLLLDHASQKAAIVDPGFGGAAVLKNLPSGFELQYILLTHGHFDHLADAKAIVDATGAKVCAHPDDEKMVLQAKEMATAFGLSINSAPTIDIYLNPGEPFLIGEKVIEIRHTPGHSPGGISFILPDTAIVGDALFAGSIGRTDLPGSNHIQLIESIQTQLLTLPDNTRVLPGHGPETTIGWERSSNPFLQQA